MCQSDDISIESSSLFQRFETEVSLHEIPDRFTFPFYYHPHPLALEAVKQLQAHLISQKDWTHNFGLDPSKKGLVIGKMFGVLVVRSTTDELGYLWGFSGKLANSNHHKYFVPPVYDNLQKGGVLNAAMIKLNEINAQIATLESDSEYLQIKKEYEALEKEANENLSHFKATIKASKKSRQLIRRQIQSDEEKAITQNAHKTISLEESNDLRYLKRFWKIKLFHLEIQLSFYQEPINTLKTLRKKISGETQSKLFDEYTFLNQKKNTKSLNSIFQETIFETPPSGAGECATPKLLQYAFKHDLKPICMAEFWWGAPPKSEIRKHRHFYPACRGKCEPILRHMLEGIALDDNPMLINSGEEKTIDVIYEDDHMAIINKPEGMLSVPGKEIHDSVWTRMKLRYPKATGPLIVHRLDMSTSGIMVIARTKNAHKKLQAQFIQRTIDKRYEALLEGKLPDAEGTIRLPLILDILDRPRQKVCHKTGKSAITKWEVIDHSANRTRVYFYPKTGRTHQLRMHAAHHEGLNTPIVGDDLYGSSAERLCLHAQRITLNHPETNESMRFEVGAKF